MLNTLKAIATRTQYDDYEVDGLAPISIQDCVRHLEQMAYTVDEKLDFHHLYDKENVEVTGYLAPHARKVTLIRADVQVKVELINFWLLICALVLLETLVFALLTSLVAVIGFLALPVVLLVLWISDRNDKMRRARGEADRVINTLQRTFKLEKTPRTEAR